MDKLVLNSTIKLYSAGFRISLWLNNDFSWQPLGPSLAFSVRLCWFSNSGNYMFIQETKGQMRWDANHVSCCATVVCVFFKNKLWIATTGTGWYLPGLQRMIFPPLPLFQWRLSFLWWLFKLKGRPPSVAMGDCLLGLMGAGRGVC